jgi:hypothetical protein
MAATWGRAEIQVDVDGTALPRQVRALAERAGAIGGTTMGDAFNRSFSERLRDGMRTTFGRIGGWFRGIWGRMFNRGGKDIGDSFTAGFQDSMKSFTMTFDKVSKDVVRQTQDIARSARDVDFGRWADDMGRFGQVFEGIGNDMGRLAIGPGLLEDIGELRQVFDDAGDSAQNASKGFTILWRELESGSSSVDETTQKVEKNRRSWRDLARTIGGFGGRMGGGIKNFFGMMNDGLDGNGRALGRNGSAWKRLSANTRQWTLIIGAVISSMQELAGLGSAAGSGLFVLAGGITAVAVGAIGMIAAFGPFIGDLEKVPRALRSSRKAFDEFGKSAKELQEVLSVSVFEDTEAVWKSFGATLKGLQGPVRTLGRSIRGVFEDLASSIAPGTEAFENLSGLIEKSGPIFRTVMGIIGRFGATLLEAFNNPNFQRSIQEMIGWLDTLGRRFDAFVRSPGFDEWLENGRRVFGAFGSLLDTVGQVLNDLVTKESIDRLVDFIGNIERFVSGPGADILNFFGELDIFGLLAKYLADFGDALEPLGPPMIELAEGLNAVVKSGIDTLAPIIRDVAKALAPFVQGIADFVKAHPKEVADALLLIGAGFAAVKAVKIATIATDLLLFSTSVGTGGEVIRKFDTAKLGKIASGIAGIGLIAAATLIPDSFWEQFDMESHVSQNALTGAGFGAMFGGWGIIIGAGIGVITSLFTDFEASFNDVGNGILFTITSGPLGGVQGALASWFAGLVPEEWKTSDNPFERTLAMIADPVTDPGTFLTNLPTDFQTAWDLIQIGMDTFILDWQTKLATIQTDWATMWTAMHTPEFWFTIADSVGTWAAGLIETFGSTTLTIASTWGTFWNNLPGAMAGGTSTVQSTTTTFLSTLWTTFSARTGSIATTWGIFWNNLTRDPQGAISTILGIVQGWLAQLGGMFISGVSGITGGWTRFWSGLAGPVSSAVSTIIGIVQRLFGPIADAIGRVQSLFNMKGPGGGGGGGGAKAGALILGPRRILTGEAGPEAIVPLNRPLSMVNPAVRGLSAVAQGKSDFSGQGAPGAQRIVNISPGAIVVSGVLNPERAAVSVVNRISERVAS